MYYQVSSLTRRNSPGMQNQVPQKRLQWEVPLCFNHVFNMSLIPIIFLMSVQREVRLIWNTGDF